MGVFTSGLIFPIALLIVAVGAVAGIIASMVKDDNQSKTSKWIDIGTIIGIAIVFLVSFFIAIIV